MINLHFCYAFEHPPGIDVLHNLEYLDVAGFTQWQLVNLGKVVIWEKRVFENI